MTRLDRTSEVLQPRPPSAEEMEKVFQGLRAWGPEGERIVDVHKKMIAILDRMIEEQSRPGGGPKGGKAKRRV